MIKELEFLEIIGSTLSDPSFLGDDCAFLEDLNLFVTHDSLVEDVHFELKTISPYYLGRKSVAVNLSDLAANLATPKYITVALSLPNSTSTDFVKEFYRGVNDICTEYNVKVAGGDITSSSKVVISICAFGIKDCNFLTSRKSAKAGDLVISTGQHGLSSCALYCLQNEIKASKELLEHHINPTPRIKESLELKKVLTNNIATMDSSDGLMDALYKISKASDVSIEIDLKQIPVNEELREIATKTNKDMFNWIFWGGEDYELIACVSEETYKKLPPKEFEIIGKVTKKDSDYNVKITGNEQDIFINEETFNNKSFDHFKEQ